MTILVDQARWPWQGTTWCHLVSDESLPELHAFAQQLGSRRIGFQGDHYDIDIETRERAIALGATALDSRELVRRLRAAGLRLRPSSFEKWHLVDRWEDVNESSTVLATPSVPEELLRLATEHQDRPESIDGAFLVGRANARALVLHGTGPAPALLEDAAIGIHARIDANGRWAVEYVHPPLLPEQ